jgi:hypothetical protein
MIMVSKHHTEHLKNKPYVYKRAELLGIPVMDAIGSQKVIVLKEDVARAMKMKSEHCALARAALRIPGVVAAYFFRSCAFLEYPDKMVRFTLPQSVQKEIVSFDRARVFADGVYQISPPPPSSRLTGMRRKSANARKIREVRREPQKHVGQRTVSGIKSSKAPEPLPRRVRYVHRTQYVRDMRA